MKRTIELNIGGKLETGDVVGIAYNNCVVFGWFVEPGKYGSLKFLRFGMVDAVTTSYDNFVNGGNVSASFQKKFEKGLQYKHFYRDYIVSFSKVTNRAFKISDPGVFFAGAGKDEQEYTKGKKILNDLKFPAK